MRVAQPKGRRGSLKWLQRAVNLRPDVLRHPAIGAIEWRSPLGEDDYAEYRDAALLHRVGCSALSDDRRCGMELGGICVSLSP